MRTVLWKIWLIGVFATVGTVCPLGDGALSGFMEMEAMAQESAAEESGLKSSVERDAQRRNSKAAQRAERSAQRAAQRAARKNADSENSTGTPTATGAGTNGPGASGNSESKQAGNPESKRTGNEKSSQEKAEKSTDVSAQRVQEAIAGGIAFLRLRQSRNGNWPEADTHTGGITALCTLALLNCGLKPGDVTIDRALEYLRSIDPTSGAVRSNYVASLQTMVFCMATPKKDAGLIRRNVEFLQDTQKLKGGKAGAWGYPDGFGDPSNAQFALLALYEAAQIGLEIRPDVWTAAADYWKRTQNIDGSWAYVYLPPDLGRQSPGTGSMTCAGIVSLIIAAEKSELADARVQGGKFYPCLRQNTDLSRRISHGKRWVASKFSVTRNPGNSDWLFYYLYGLERMGRMTEQRFIGEHDWFREGVVQILKSGRVSAIQGQLVVSWKGGSSSELYETIATPLALLFLSKGRYPVLMSKVDVLTEAPQTGDWNSRSRKGKGSKTASSSAGGDLEEDWNWHRHDIMNLARYVEKRWNTRVTTQNIRLSQASVEGLMQSPVLYISGRNAPLSDDPKTLRENATKLRDYIDRGGFIIAEAVAPGGTFDRGLRQLVKLMFPEGDYQLSEMPPEHPIWRAEIPIDPVFVRPVFTLDYGCRTCMVFLPAEKNPQPSLSCLWELANEAKPTADHPNAIKARILAGLDLGVNILAYATNRELKTKDAAMALAADLNEAENDQKPSLRGKLAMANLRHGGGCEVAPKALRNLLQEAAKALNLKAGVLEETIAITSDELFTYPVVFLQGRNAFRFTPKEREQLLKYLEQGGLIFANSICASKAFDEALRQELKQIVPDANLTKLGRSEPILTPRYGGYDLSKVQIRSRDKGLVEGQVMLEGLQVKGRYAVIYSPLDISCALEKHGAMDCYGYTAEDAAKIGINVLLYSMQ